MAQAPSHPPEGSRQEINSHSGTAGRADPVTKDSTRQIGGRDPDARRRDGGDVRAQRRRSNATQFNDLLARLRNAMPGKNDMSIELESVFEYTADCYENDNRNR